jgi:hypothetical protein
MQVTGETSSHRNRGLEQLWPTLFGAVGDPAPTRGEDMTEAPGLPLLKRVERPPPVPRSTRTTPAPVPSIESSKPVEIVAPDDYCATLLLEDAVRFFPAELVHGSGWIVRLHPPPGAEWALLLFSILEGWMDSIPLPCTKVLYGDKSYLIHATAGTHQTAAFVKPSSATAI